jgi:hypothetical protein
MINATILTPLYITSDNALLRATKRRRILQLSLFLNTMLPLLGNIVVSPICFYFLPSELIQEL